VAGLACRTFAAAATTPEQHFSEALAEAEANLATPEGRAYDRSLAVYLRQENAVVLNGCFKTTAKPDLTSFEVVFRVAKDGRVLDAVVWPETNVGTCLRDGLTAKTFPLPPKDAYRAQLRMNLGR
jgi:hypothetical protein